MVSRLVLKPRFRLATFDVTNTLLKFATSVGDQYSNVGLLYGVKSDPSQINAAFVHHWKLMRQLHPNYGRTTGLTSQAWWKEIIKKSFYEGGLSTISDDQLAAISDHLFQLYSTEKCWRVPAGVIEQLKFLKYHNVVLGIISNFDERLNSVLISTGLRSYFQFVLASYVVECEKPNREIFDLALQKVGLQGARVDASNAIHVGDNLHLDYLAAKNAGWNSLLLRDQNDSDTEATNFIDENEVIYSLKEISQYILKS